VLKEEQCWVPGHAAGPLPPPWLRRMLQRFSHKGAAPAPHPPISCTSQQSSPGSRAGPGAAGRGTGSEPKGENEPRGDHSRGLGCRDRNPGEGAGGAGAAPLAWGRTGSGDAGSRAGGRCGASPLARWGEETQHLPRAPSSPCCNPAHAARGCPTPTTTPEEQRALFKNMFMYTGVARTGTFITYGTGGGGQGLVFSFGEQQGGTRGWRQPGGGLGLAPAPG